MGSTIRCHKELYHRLSSVTDNSIIDINTDEMLLSIVPFVNLKNITIIGHGNPTVNCDNNCGGIYFNNCHNCTIRGITWEKCGGKADDGKPVIGLNSSSNITIQNCSFQNSVTQAISLSEMSGKVNIKSCNFIYNNRFEGNGTAIHYLSKIKHHHEIQLMISSCNFIQNGASNDTSIVYIAPSSNKSLKEVHFTDYF